MGLVDTVKRWYRGQALQSARMDVVVRGLTAACTVHYTFENASRRAIEALYTFPMPPEAAFVGLAAEIGGERLEARVVAAPEADRRYEDAIAEGHSALLLRQVQPGLLHAALGNIGPGEKASFTLSYALSLECLDRRARLSLPTVIRPRYGHWRLEDLETPEHHQDAAYRLEAGFAVEGLLAAADIRCPTHRLAFRREGATVRLVLEEAWLDGDVVLEFGLDRDLDQVAECFVEGEGVGCRIDLVVPDRTRPASGPLHLAMVLDCSGSMSGDAIAGCRAALLEVAGQLAADDRIQVLRFGSEVHALLRRPMRLTDVVRRSLGDLAGVIEADLGGTEMGVALDRAIDDLLRTREEGGSQAVFLVTDGAVQPEDIASARRRACAEGIRVFIVAVGSSASVATLTPLARDTLGSLEQAVPGQSIADAVMRQLRRMREAVPLRVGFGGDETVTAPTLQISAQPKPDWAEPGQWAYPGDAISLHACFPKMPNTLVFVDPASRQEQSIAPTLVDATPDRRALLAMARYRAAADRVQAREIAVAGGLLTPETAAVVVRHRADGERFESLPEMQVQPQMAARGIMFSRVAPAPPMACPSSISDADPDFSFSLARSRSRRQTGSDTGEFDLSPFHAGADIRESAARYRLPDLTPVRQRELIAALMTAMREALVEPTPTLAREALLGRLEPADRAAIEGLAALWLDGAPGVLAWCLLLDLLVEWSGGLDAVAEDRLADALLAMGYLGAPEPERQAVRARIKSGLAGA